MALPPRSLPIRWVTEFFGLDQEKDTW
jgi:hypothetical protein